MRNLRNSSSKLWLMLLLVSIIILIVIGISSLALNFYRFSTEIEDTVVLINEINDQLGFDDGHSIGTKDMQRVRQAYVFGHIEEGWVMDNAGVVLEDEIQLSQSDFYKLLVQNQGSQISVPIVRGGTAMTINIDVPVLTLSIDPDQLHWLK